MAANYNRSPGTYTESRHRPRSRVEIIDQRPLPQEDPPAVPKLTAIETPIEIDDLYPAQEAGSPDLSRALRLLSSALQAIHEAIELLQEGDPIGSDLAAQRLYGILVELFNCRRLGDGFGAVVNAIQCAIENLNGLPLDLKQTRAIGQILTTLRAEPYMAFSVAAVRLDGLEDVGLSISPQGFEYLAEWLDGQSLR